MESDLVAAAFAKAMRLDASFVLQDQMTFDDVPGWDSVGHMNLISELESQCDISLDMDEIVGLDSVQSVRELVKRKKAA